MFGPGKGAARVGRITRSLGVLFWSPHASSPESTRTMPARKGLDDTPNMSTECSASLFARNGTGTRSNCAKTGFFSVLKTSLRDTTNDAGQLPACTCHVRMPSLVEIGAREGCELGAQKLFESRSRRGFRGVPQGFPPQNSRGKCMDRRTMAVCTCRRVLDGRWVDGCALDVRVFVYMWVGMYVCALRACTLETLRVAPPNPRKSEVKPTWSKNLEFQRTGDKARVLDPSRLPGQ